MILKTRPTRMDDKGRIVLPLAVRQRLGISPGDFVLFDLDIRPDHECVHILPAELVPKEAARR